MSREQRRDADLSRQAFTDLVLPVLSEKFGFTGVYRKEGDSSLESVVEDQKMGIDWKLGVDFGDDEYPINIAARMERVPQPFPSITVRAEKECLEKTELDKLYQQIQDGLQGPFLHVQGYYWNYSLSQIVIAPSRAVIMAAWEKRQSWRRDGMALDSKHAPIRHGNALFYPIWAPDIPGEMVIYRHSEFDPASDFFPKIFNRRLIPHIEQIKADREKRKREKDASVKRHLEAALPGFGGMLFDIDAETRDQFFEIGGDRRPPTRRDT
jgi:hypothetical protein